VLLTSFISEISHTKYNSLRQLKTDITCYKNQSIICIAKTVKGTTWAPKEIVLGNCLAFFYHHHRFGWLLSFGSVPFYSLSLETS